MLERPPSPSLRGRGAARARAAAIVVAAALGAGALVALQAARGDGVTAGIGGVAWYAGRPAWFEATGFHSPELSPEGARFNWTTDHATLDVPRVDRSRPLRLTLRGHLPARPGAPPVRLVASVDGQPLIDRTLRPGGQRLTLALPVRAEPGARVELRVEPVGFREEAGARLPMGFVVHRVRLERADGGRLPVPGASLLAAAAAAALYAAAGLLLGAGAVPAALLGGAAAFWHAVLLLQGGAFLGAHATTLAALGAAVLGLALAVRALAGRCRLAPETLRAALLVAAVTGAALAWLTHPAMPPLDADFQVRNAERVRGGELLFTSATPPPAFQFPYAIALYVAALPLWGVVADHVLLLRLVTLLAEAAAALALGAAVARLRPGPWTATLVAVLLLLSPARIQTLGVGNLSNNFGQALLVAGLAALLPPIAGRARPVAALALLAAAFLSHFGVLLLGLPLALGLVLAWHGAGVVDARAVRRLALVPLLAAAAAGLLYYAQFLDVYRGALGRLLGGRAAIGAGVLAAPWTVKLARAGLEALAGWGGGALLLALVGTRAAFSRRDALAALVPAWLAVVAGFAALGVASPLELRWGLAGSPLVAALAALGLASLADARAAARLAGAALGVAVLLEAAQAALAPLVR